MLSNYQKIKVGFYVFFSILAIFAILLEGLIQYHSSYDSIKQDNKVVDLEKYISIVKIDRASKIIDEHNVFSRLTMLEMDQIENIIYKSYINGKDNVKVPKDEYLNLLKKRMGSYEKCKNSLHNILNEKEHALYVKHRIGCTPIFPYYP